MYIIQITRINFKNRPDEQTVSYAKRVPEWMSQWTVRNNYMPLLCDDLEGGLREQLANIADQFWADMNSAVPELCKRTKAEHMADFSFDYTIHSGGPGLKTVYHGGRNFEYLQVVPPVEADVDAENGKTFAAANWRTAILRFVDRNFSKKPAQAFRSGWPLQHLFDEEGANAPDADAFSAEFEDEFHIQVLDRKLTLNQLVLFCYKHGTLPAAALSAIEDDRKAIRPRLIRLINKEFPQGNLADQFITHGYTLKQVLDEVGQEDVDDLFTALAAEFDVGSPVMIDMTFDQIIMYIEEYHESNF